jgi:hypothetical protein
VSSATIWNRIEPRARSGGLAGGLAARVHDPLWLLARQWQMGEFAGRDAGSPLTAQVHWTTAAFDRFASGSAAPQPLTANTPIEMLIEREFVRPQQAAGDLLQAAESGLQFLRLLDAANLSRLRPAYIQQYPLAAPANAGSDALGFASVVAGRALNGIQLRANLATAPSGSLPAQPALSAADVTAVTPIATAWTAWYDSLFNEPAAPSSWSPARMEYSFALGAAADANGLVAQEYDGGSIDWYSFDRATSPLAGGTAQPITSSRTITVAPVTFRGMPARRFWQIENAAVNIGALDAAASDIGRLLLREFALTYGNDWFQIPLALPVGCHAVINSLSIIDTFGLTTTIPHYAAVDGASGNWQLFSLDIVGPSLTAPNEAPTTNLLILPPGGVNILDSAPIEDVLMLRDDPAEMAWGVERTVAGPSGSPLDRALAWRTAQPPIVPPSGSTIPAYRLGSTVPDYWIPFLPVSVDTGPLQLRRGRLPTASAGPEGQLLAYPNQTIFFEELPREGVHLVRRYRLARGLDGSTYLWIGRLRSTGLGGGRSGLRFDFLDFS